jgi:putative transcription factor
MHKQSSCEMCGGKGAGITVIIEGVSMKVCKNCCSFGKVAPRQHRERVEKTFTKRKPRYKSPEEETQERVIASYGSRIQKKRNQLGLKQEELARKVAEKESIIQKMENGNFRPSLAMAKKLERILGIKLIESGVVEKTIHSAGKSEGMTLAHFLKK